MGDSSERERDIISVDVLVVGAGPAGLSAALRLAQLNRQSDREPLTIAVLEKSREVGAHLLSGAVLDPIALRELVPDYQTRGAPLESEVHADRVYVLTKTGKIQFPLTPPPLKNHGHYIISLSRFTKWLSTLVEAEGVDVFSGFPGTDVLYDEERVIGVKTGNRGIDKHGNQKPTFEPGVEIRAKVTVFADGVRGNLTKQLVARSSLDSGRLPQVYALGLKELWEIPAGRVPAGTVMHTMGFPLRYDEFGGGFIYALSGTRMSVGFVVGLDYHDPMFDPYVAFQRYKQHPLVSRLLDGGEMIRYGAKALPEGGWHAIPQPFTGGALIVGDAGGYLNSLRLKGIHLAMKTGMLAAEAAAKAIGANDVSANALSRFQELVDGSYVRGELYPVRNVHQSFGYGLLPGLAYAGLSLLTGGWWVREPMPARPGYERMRTRKSFYDGNPPLPEDVVVPIRFDRRVTFDKLTAVHLSGTRHDEDQPSHLLVADTDICRTRCREEFGNPCQRFCPANVYEMVDAGDGSGKRLQINASNCVHCKTCDVHDPYQIITWVPPEGGEGPQYDGM